MSDLAQVDPSQWPTSPAVRTIDIPNLGRGSRQVRTSEDGKTFWCMSCDTRLDRRRMHCDEHTRERANLLQGGRLPSRRTVNGFVEVMRDANDLLELIGEATVQFQGLQLGLDHVQARGTGRPTRTKASRTKPLAGGATTTSRKRASAI